MLTRNPEWLKELSPTATVSHADATKGLVDAFKPRIAMPGPRNPIDCKMENSSEL